MKTSHLIIFCFLAFGFLVSLKSADYPEGFRPNAVVQDQSAPSGENPPTGQRVIVQFRRDSLGLASQVVLSPTSGGLGGGKSSLTGMLVSVHDDWLVLRIQNGEQWIARDTVLLVEIP